MIRKSLKFRNADMKGSNLNRIQNCDTTGDNLNSFKISIFLMVKWETITKFLCLCLIMNSLSLICFFYPVEDIYYVLHVSKKMFYSVKMRCFWEEKSTSAIFVQWPVFQFKISIMTFISKDHESGFKVRYFFSPENPICVSRWGSYGEEMLFFISQLEHRESTFKPIFYSHATLLCESRDGEVLPGGAQIKSAQHSRREHTWAAETVRARQGLCAEHVGNELSETRR